MPDQAVRLLYLTAEPWPTHRADLISLFGKYLPRLGIHSDLLTEQVLETAPQWPGGEALLRRVPGSRSAHYVIKLWHSLRGLACADAGRYDAIQVRDMSVTAVAALLMARLKGLPFYYWLSYPQSEGQIDRARQRGLKGGMRFWFPLLQGHVGKWLLYRLVLPRADHVFVQSRQMQLDLAGHGIPMEKMTPVPMGVDTEVAGPDQIVASTDVRLQGRRVITYLGVMDPVRQVDVLFHMLLIVRRQFPEVLLVLAGDTEDASHRAWLQAELQRLDLNHNVLWLGWRPSAEAWSYVRAAELGLSPFPRGYLLDSASPTKAVEYMGLGLPVVVNDNPDQEQVVRESGAGRCVPLDACAFAQAVTELLAQPDTMREMGRQGRAYVLRQRGYDSIARGVAATYRRLLDARVVRERSA
ncbi:glycosyltransferase [Duganella sp. BuS-21]|uniref:glycosyltransferase n=1 Tax=Duganella sp. BuS-21 TaxID=2943848 RepID=UPI0035A6E266